MWDKRTLRDFPPLCSGALYIHKIHLSRPPTGPSWDYKAHGGLLRGYVYQRTEGVYRDVKGNIREHQDTSGNIEVFQGILRYTKIISV